MVGAIWVHAWCIDAGVQMSPETARLSVAMVMVHALTTPSYQQLIRWCAHSSDYHWAADCRPIARLRARVAVDRDYGICSALPSSRATVNSGSTKSMS